MKKQKKKKNKVHQFISDTIKITRKNIKSKIYKLNYWKLQKEKSIIFNLDFLKSHLISKIRNKQGILLIPPTELDGSFGDELMVITFVNRYKNIPITLYEPLINVREDLFRDYQNVSYLKWEDSLRGNSFVNGIFILGADNMTPNYGYEDQFFKCKVLRIGNKLKVKTGILAFSLNQSIFGSPHEKWFVDLLPNSFFYIKGRRFICYCKANFT